jgi:uncharacterized protein YjbI with pentapeptide repeats
LVFVSVACAASLLCVVAAAENFKGQDLRMRDFSNQNLDGSTFEDAKCFLARFANTSLAKANFQGADLSSATFSGANAEGADFRDAVFGGTSMQSSNFTGANFQGTNLGNISFQGSTLKGANLNGAKGLSDLQNADLRDADLRGAVFIATAYYMGGVRLRGAQYDSKTRWPAGFDVAASGAVLNETPAAPQPSGAALPPLPPSIAPPPPPVPLPVSPPPAPSNLPGSALPTPPTSSVAASAPAPLDPVTGERKPPKLDGEALTEDVVKYLLETTMWAGKDLRRFAFDYASLKIALPRPGNNLQDIASGKPRTVTPVRVEVKMTKFYDNNETRDTRFKQDYDFFRDEFGAWTYRFQADLE